MGNYYGGGDALFTLFHSPGTPAWRRPQLGALGALAGQWSLANPQPGLISLPTGTGKTAVAVAAAHLRGSGRVLVVVPSTELRRQLATAFRGEDVLLRIGALTRKTGPSVLEVTGLVERWDDLMDADVVVAIPNSISPLHYTSNPPPTTLFDLVIIDEAHHAPAPTWRAIIDYFSEARSILLTATPRRRDGQHLPGERVYHYPLRQALEEGIFKSVQPQILAVPPAATHEQIDGQIADQVNEILSDPQHETSTLLIRAGTRQRAYALAELYTARNIPVRVLHSSLAESTQRAIIEDLRAGVLKAVAVVGMLIEGFDLPSIRVAAYHDKHKSLPATAQLIGRLARADAGFPQPSVLVTARDVDVFPELKGVVRFLYEEDTDWATVLPGIVDEQITQELADRAFAATFHPAPPMLSIEAIHPIRRSRILEVPAPEAAASFSREVIPDSLTAGRLLRGRTILYADLNHLSNTFVVITSLITRPKWHGDPGLDSPTFDLHLVSFRQSSQSQLPGLLLINSADAAVARELLTILQLDALTRPADPALLQLAFDSLERISVSSVGVRNTYAGRGGANYRMFAGSGVDRGLRETDVAFGALGHAKVQVSDQGGAFTAGVSTGKGKWWETRYVPFREYDAFITTLAERYWFPPAAPSGQLLPQITRGRRLIAWPAVSPLASELDYALLGAGWVSDEFGPLEFLDLRAETAGSSGTPGLLPLSLTAVQKQDQPVVWRGHQDLLGNVVPDGEDALVRRGFSGPETLSELLSVRPPTIFFVDGTTVHGTTVYESRLPQRRLPTNLFRHHSWLPEVDITAETRATALGHGHGVSIHEALETYLRSRPRRAKHRWIMCNDGKGELADYVVLEVGRNTVTLALWHAKFAHGSEPSVRVTDLQEVLAQAIKRRRWITDVRLWEELGSRLNGRASPRLTLVEGSERLLQVICGEVPRWQDLSFRRTRPIVDGQVAVAQPGLSEQLLQSDLLGTTPSLVAMQSRDLLAVFHDSVSMVASAVVLCSA